MNEEDKIAVPTFKLRWFHVRWRPYILQQWWQYLPPHTGGEWRDVPTVSYD